MIQIAVFAAAFGLAFFMIMQTKKMCIVYGFHDIPDERKVHKEKVPTMGGLAIFASVWTVILLLDITGIFTFGHIVFRVLSVSLALFIVGLVDDVKGVSAKLKFILQIIAGALFFIWNRNNTVVLFDNLLLTNIMLTSFSVLWFALVINSINFVDGLDGLSSGVSIIIASVLLIFSFVIAKEYISLLLISLIASLCAFLIFNFYPAKIFMGDTGSLFIGGIFSMSVMLLVYHQIDKWFAYVILFTYPIMDVGLAIVRRIALKKPLFMPDSGHIHHVIKGKNISHSKSVLTIYLLNLVYAMLSLLYFFIPGAAVVLIYAGYTIFLSTVFLRRMLKSGDEKCS